VFHVFSINIETFSIRSNKVMDLLDFGLVPVHSTIDQLGTEVDKSFGLPLVLDQPSQRPVLILCLAQNIKSQAGCFLQRSWPNSRY